MDAVALPNQMGIALVQVICCDEIHLELEAEQKALYDSVNKLAAISICENKDEWNAQANEARILFNQMFGPDIKEGRGRSKSGRSW